MSGDPVRAALDAARDWAGFWIVIKMPRRWAYAEQGSGIMNRLYWAALPYAGNWAYRADRATTNAAQEGGGDGQ